MKKKKKVKRDEVDLPSNLSHDYPRFFHYYANLESSNNTSQRHY